MWHASDEALVAGLGAADTDAALVFVRRFQSRVYGVALAIVRDPQAAEEVAQDAFVRAWRYSSSFDPRRGAAAAWLMAIARNAALDHVRARGRRLDQPGLEPILEPNLESNLESSGLFGDLPASDEPPNAHEELSAVAGAVRSLPPDQRETLMAAAYYGFSAREISEAWEVPIGTVKTRLRLAVHKLRDELTWERRGDQRT